MRICFIWTGVSRVGGVSSWIRQCLRALPSLGIEAYALDIARNQVPGVESDEAVARIIRLSFGRWDSEATFEWRVRRAFARIKPDVLIFNEQVCASGILSATRCRIPAINVVHSDRESAYPVIAELVCAGVSVVCVSRLVEGKLMSTLPQSFRDRVRHSVLGVDIPAHPEPAPWQLGAPLQMVYIGRLTSYQKRIEDLPPFLTALSRHKVDWRLHIAGDGPEQATLLDALCAGDWMTRVTFYGPLPHREVLRLLEQCHVIMLFSSSEGLPLSLLEGMSRGAIPVVTNLPGGIAEVVQDNVNGRLYPVGDMERAAELIEELSRSETNLVRLRHAAMKTAAVYSFEKQICQFVDLFKQVARGPRPTPVSGGETGLRRYVPKRWLELRDAREAESNQEPRTKNPKMRPCP